MFTLVTVTHQFLNLDGSFASGKVVFKLSNRITNGGTSYASELPIEATLNAQGQLSVQLPANDDTATTPAGSYYLVTLMLNGASEASPAQPMMIVVPSTAVGGTVDLGTLLPAQEGN